MSKCLPKQTPLENTRFKWNKAARRALRCCRDGIRELPGRRGGKYFRCPKGAGKQRKRSKTKRPGGRDLCEWFTGKTETEHAGLEPSEAGRRRDQSRRRWKSFPSDGKEGEIQLLNAETSECCSQPALIRSQTGAVNKTAPVLAQERTSPPGQAPGPGEKFPVWTGTFVSRYERSAA